MKMSPSNEKHQITTMTNVRKEAIVRRRGKRRRRCHTEPSDHHHHHNRSSSSVLMPKQFTIQSSLPTSFTSFTSSASSFIRHHHHHHYSLLTLLILSCLVVPFQCQLQLQVTSSPPPPVFPLLPTPPSSNAQPSIPPPSSSSIISDEFSPLVTAQCDRGVMTITIVTSEPFVGVAHTRDSRKAPCMVNGTGSTNTTLRISLLASAGDELYCGVQRFKGERSVSLAVRPHKSLELSEDRFFYLTCHTGYKNVKGGTYRVSLKLIDQAGARVNRLVHGAPYTLRAELYPRDSITTLRMKNCFIFSKAADNVELIDRSGCPAKSGLVTAFTYNDSATGEARIPEMFKFADDVKVHFQCDALLCRENCDEPDCEGTSTRREFELDGYSQVSASTTVFIKEPSDSNALESGTDSPLECTEWRFPWLITLCICLAIMLLVMLLLNLFMCSSMTCRCIKTEVNEKEPDEFEEYDPYRADWTAPNSLHGSRYSLEHARRAQNQNQQGYTSDENSVTSDGTFRRNESRNTAGTQGHQRPVATAADYDNESYVPDRQYVHHQPSAQQTRNRRNVTTSEEDSSEDDDDRRGIHRARPDSRTYSVHSASARPIRPREIEYEAGGYPYTHQRY